MTQDMDNARRQALLENHPIIEREYTLLTPMLRSAYAIAHNRVWTRRTGVVFYGEPRIGKTKCAEEIRRLLQENFKKAYISMAYARRTARPNDGHMFRLILEAEGHALSARKDHSQLFNNAITDVELEVSKRKGSQFILLIDEMQLLNETDLQQLVVFHNELCRKKIKMTTISFAQPEILHRRTALMTMKQTQIIARFLSEPLKFEGCATLEELTKLLESYDEGSQYPEDSGWSYTRFFAPIGFSSGFRLRNYASLIWEGIEVAFAGSSNRVAPMEHLCLIIENLLIKLWDQDCPGLTLSKEEVTEAVDYANLENCNKQVESGIEA